ncbi:MULTISPECIES: flagellar FlbD family protein [Paenibacillus]|jgi:flagellar protein FlbD|uniref:Flagellar protein FlbD n=2 Tax=Paenibacillus barengoltzii TaxID=343517 RepID=R9LLP8_9BACL|nr:MULTISPECIES: flagellar FlbD family protein [Paenibacillus]EOS56672.1 flagellar protein FlbD [Paenibacillus barengoltzii G22]MDU0331374.1 flagellar FlbD family protein [Paenibacillus sp. 3LSP]MEC2346043.1 flagellar FlbD family protein [Paenibacillus barengoltzii]SME93430.1 flagellar protein FlbD [Paenibacillus barengoltzii]SMF21573.1 flagellar protein FlbD [Paenibacillus barengoltzii J12]
MISVTRLNGSQMWLNAIMIETVEETPDTYVTLVTGKRIIVLEKAADVIQMISDYYREIGIHAATIKVQQTEEWS